MASVPLIGALYTEETSSEPEGLRACFLGANGWGGALLASDAATGSVIGSSRSQMYEPALSGG